MGSDLRVVVDAQTAGFEKGIQQVLRRFGDLRRSHVQTVVTTGALERQTRQLTRELDRQRRSLGLLTLQWVAFRRALMTAAIRTAVTGFAALTSTVAALGAELVLLTTTLGAFAGAAAIAGASALMGVGQAAIVSALALKGVGKAITATGTDFDKAMAKLTKPARGFVREIKSMQTAFREIKLLAQEGLFSGLERAARKIKPLLEPVKQVVYDTATAMGYLAESLATVAASRAGDLKAIGERNVVSLRRMGDAAINFGTALIDVFQAADPLIGHITAGIVTFSEELAGAAAKARANGSLGSFFEYLRKSWDAWTSVAGNLGHILVGVLKAAAGPALDLAHSIDHVTERWAAFVNSTRGQKSLGGFFRDSEKVMGAFVHLLGDTLKMFGRLSGPGSDSAVAFFNLLDEKLLPVIEQMALSFDQHLFPAFMDLIGAVLDLTLSALPGLEKIGQAFSWFVLAVADVVDGIRQLTDGLGPLPRALDALMLGAGVVVVWRKLGQAIQLAFLSLRRFLGLAPEMAVMRPGLGMLFKGGGRLDAPAPGNGVPAMAVGGGGGRGGRPGRAAAPRFQITGGGLYRDMPAGFRGAYGPRGDGLSRVISSGPMLGPTSRPYGAAADPRQWIGSRPSAYQIAPPLPGFRGFRDRMRVPNPLRAFETGRTRAPIRMSGPARPVDLSESNMRNLPPGQRAGAYRQFQNTNAVANRGRVAAIGDMTAEMARSTRTGLVKGATMAKPVLGLAIGAAAVSGIVGGLSSGAKTIGGRLKDALSAATFGLTESTGEAMAKQASKLGGLFGGGTGSMSAKALGSVVDFSAPSMRNDKAMLDKLFGAGRLGAEPNRKINFADPTQNAALKTMVGHLQELGKLSDDDAAKLNKMLDGIKSRVDGLGGLKGKQLKDALAAGLDFGAPVARAETAMGRIKTAFDALGKSKGLDQLKGNVKANVAIINGELGRGTEPGRYALAKNFKLAAQAVRDQMKASGKTTKEGTALIRHYLIQSLHELGLTHNAGDYLQGKDPTGGKFTLTGEGARSGQGKARGGLARIPGQVGPDSVPMQVAGRNIIAAPGEDVAIFTRHQRAYLDQRLADVGGLGGVFGAVPAAHNHPAYAKGGMVTGDTDYLPAVGVALERMAKMKGVPIFVQSGGRTKDEQLALIHKYGANNPAHPVAGLNGPHVRRIAADITPGREVFGDVAEKVGLGFTVPNESWHVQLLNAAAAMVAPALRRLGSTMGGGPGAIVTAGLARVGDAAQSVLDSAFAQAGSGGDGSDQGGGGGGAATGNGADLMKAIAKSRGWKFADWWDLDNRETSHGRNLANPTSTARLRGQFLDSNYGKYGPGSDPAQNPTMAQQIQSMADYIAERYGNPSAALNWHKVHNWYRQGGLIEAAGGVDIPARDQGTPTVNPNDAVTPKSKAKPKAKKKAPKPFTGGPGYPKLAKIKAGKVKPKKAWRSKFKRWDLPDAAQTVDPGVVPDFGALFDRPALTITNRLDALAGDFALTDEQPIVNDALNWKGTTLDGKFVPGIDQHVDELHQLLSLHTGAPDGSGAEGLLGLWTRELAEMGSARSRVGIGRVFAKDTLKQIRLAWRAEHARHAHAVKKVAKLNKGSQSWQQRVADNKARIDAIEDWKRDVRTDTVGHRKTDALARQLVRADKDIDELRDENTKLEDTKPPPKGTSKKADAARLKSLRHWQGISGDSGREMDFLTGNREEWSTGGGVAAEWQNRIEGHTTVINQLRDDMQTLSEATLPAERTQIKSLVMELGDWLGTTLTGPTQSASDQAAFEKERADNALRDLAVAQAQFATFSGFAPLLQARFVGAFAHGGVVPETGMALVHKGETINPAPDGPYGSKMSTGAAPNWTLVVDVDGDLAPLIRKVDARIEQVAPGAVSRVSGRKQRLVAGAPGGR